MHKGLITSIIGEYTCLESDVALTRREESMLDMTAAERAPRPILYCKEIEIVEIDKLYSLYGTVNLCNQGICEIP